MGTHAQKASNKEKALLKYKNEYLASRIEEAPDLKWKGSIENCNPGQISPKAIQKALLRINYFRTLCGLRPVQFTNEYNNEAQRAAFINHANKKLSHDPDKSWLCYSEEARLSAAHSNIGTTNFSYYPDFSFITGFIEDQGQSNDDVGHRRSLLFSRAEYMGYGATPNTEAVRSPTQKVNKGDSLLLPKYFSYPATGYNEIDLLFPRWSFSIPDVYTVNWKETIVELRDDTGKQINVRVLPRYNIYDPTIVWEIADKLKRDYYLTHTFSVSVKNVRVNEKLSSYDYDIMFFDYTAGKGK